MAYKCSLLGETVNLDHLRKDQGLKVDELNCHNLVVGDDLFSMAIYEQLQRDQQPTTISIMSVPLAVEELTPKGPSLLRGEANIELFKSMFPDIELHESLSEPLFFKEQKFRTFNGRSKSEKLLWGESFYKNHCVDINYKSLYPFLEEDNLIANLNEKVQQETITQIERVVKEAVEDDCSYIVSCLSGQKIRCKRLYWGLGPLEFLHLYKEKSQLSNGFIQFCEETKTPCSLHIKFLFDEFTSNPLNEVSGTIFLPISYTHDWGHFIGEVKGNQIEFLTFIDHEHTDEADILKRIRILKRLLERIYPLFKEVKYEEFIQLKNNSFCHTIDDNLYKKLKGEMGQLFFIGANSPIDDSSADISHLTRGLVTERNLMHQLSKEL